MTVMKPVVQEDVTGCGIASVATLAGLTYQKTKTLAHQLGIDIKDPRLWSDTTQCQQDFVPSRCHLMASRARGGKAFQALKSISL